MAAKTKKNRIKEEKARLTESYERLPDSKRRNVEGLIDRAAFMRIELEDLEEFLKENDWTEPFAQGNQEPYDRMRPKGQTYQTMAANYQKVIKLLDDLLPKEEVKPAESDDDGFDGFVNGRDNG